MTRTRPEKIGRFRGTRGFTAIELFITVALVGIMTVVAIPFLGSMVQSDDLSRFSEQAAVVLQEARAGAMHGKFTGRFGVHFETDRFVYFEGDTYSAGDPDNETYTLTEHVSITAITLNGGGNEMLFLDHRGETAQYGSVEFTDAAGTTRTVSVNAAGMIDVQ